MFIKHLLTFLGGTQPRVYLEQHHSWDKILDFSQYYTRRAFGGSKREHSWVNLQALDEGNVLGEDRRRNLLRQRGIIADFPRRSEFGSKRKHCVKGKPSKHIPY